MSLVAHQFGRDEFWILNICCFYRQALLKKSKQIFEIRLVQINELPRTWETGYQRKVLKNQNFQSRPKPIFIIIYSKILQHSKFMNDDSFTISILITLQDASFYDRQVTVFLFSMFQNPWFILQFELL